MVSVIWLILIYANPFPKKVEDNKTAERVPVPQTALHKILIK